MSTFLGLLCDFCEGDADKVALGPKRVGKSQFGRMDANLVALLIQCPDQVDVNRSV